MVLLGGIVGIIAVGWLTARWMEQEPAPHGDSDPDGNAQATRGWPLSFLTVSGAQNDEPAVEPEEPTDAELWDTRMGAMAVATAQLTDGQLIRCDVRGLGISGKGYFSSEDPQVDPEGGRHAVLPYLLHSNVTQGQLLVNALPATERAVWTTNAGDRYEITWQPSGDGEPVRCTSVQQVAQRTGLHGRVDAEGEPTGRILVTGCGGMVQLSGEGGSFFMDVDTGNRCVLVASRLGLGPVPPVGLPQLGPSIAAVVDERAPFAGGHEPVGEREIVEPHLVARTLVVEREPGDGVALTGLPTDPYDATFEAHPSGRPGVG